MNEEGIILQTFRQAAHPRVAFFHVAFKALAIFFYYLPSFVTINFVLTFVLIVLLLAFDFWTVKNVSGRLLVGMRWWNKIKDDGSNEWIFESIQDRSKLNSADGKIFWWSQYGAMVTWSVIALVAGISLSTYTLIALVACSLTYANIFGYTKCDKDAKAKMKNMMSSGIGAAMGTDIGKAVSSQILSSAFGFGGGK